MKPVKLFYIFSAAALFFSCNDFLDTLPDNRAEVNDATSITKLLVSAYQRYQPATTIEWMSDNVDYNGAEWGRYSLLQEEAFYWKDITDTGRDSPTVVWSSCYLAIATANQALKAIDDLGRPADLNPQRGEALLCRAYGHFVLVNIFCLHYDASKEKDDNDYTDPDYYGIPYITTPETTVDREVDRKNVCYVYEQINKDIEEALPLIDGNIYSAPKFHFNREAAYAFASKFNLYYCNFAKAVEYATEALGSNPEEKLRSWADMAASSNNTIRGYLYVNDQIPANFLMSTVYSLNAATVNSGNCRFAHSRLISSTETTGSDGIWGNYRNIYMQGTAYIGYPYIAVRKLIQFTQVADPITGSIYNHNIWIHFTADETLLHRAEAYVMLAEQPGQDRESCYENAAQDLRQSVESFTKSTTSREIINSTFGNMDYYTPDAPTPKKALHPKFEFKSGEQENFIHAILHCRRVLFIHEGHRWYDVKRWGIQIDRREIKSGKVYLKTLTSLGPDDKRRAVQIPGAIITAGIPANPR